MSSLTHTHGPVPKGKKPGKVKEKRFECPEFLDYVRTLPCCVCGKMPADPHHLLRGPFPRGWNLKAPDNWCIPLCRTCHDTLHNDKDRGGDEVLFLESHGIDGPSKAEELWELFNE